MQQICNNCHRIFNISNEDITRYNNVKNYASTILWQNNVNLGDTGDETCYKLKEQSKAL